jgi:hypothetical protein
VRKKMTYTGYLRRSLPQSHGAPMPLLKIERPLSAGHHRRRRRRRGMIDWVLRAYETDPACRIPPCWCSGRS